MSVTPQNIFLNKHLKVGLKSLWNFSISQKWSKKFHIAILYHFWHLTSIFGTLQGFIESIGDVATVITITGFGLCILKCRDTCQSM